MNAWIEGYQIPDDFWRELVPSPEKTCLILLPAFPSEVLKARSQFFLEKAPDFAQFGIQVQLFSTDSAATKPNVRHLSQTVLAGLQMAGLTTPEGNLLPGVYLADEQGTLLRAYPADDYPDLPNPAMVLRAARKLIDTLRPTPVEAGDWRTGPPDAPVLLIEYSDYQCQHCAHLHQALNQVMEEFHGKLALIHRHLPLRYSHPLAQKAAEAAEAAGAQGRFWEMHHLLFKNQPRLEFEHLLAYAQQLGLDMGRFERELSSGTWKEAVDQDFKLSVQNQIKLPPTLFINNILWEGSLEAAALSQKIRLLLA